MKYSIILMIVMILLSCKKEENSTNEKSRSWVHTNTPSELYDSVNSILFSGFTSLKGGITEVGFICYKYKNLTFVDSIQLISHLNADGNFTSKYQLSPGADFSYKIKAYAIANEKIYNGDAVPYSFGNPFIDYIYPSEIRGGDTIHCDVLNGPFSNGLELKAFLNDAELTVLKVPENNEYKIIVGNNTPIQDVNKFIFKINSFELSDTLFRKRWLHLTDFPGTFNRYPLVFAIGNDIYMGSGDGVTDFYKFSFLENEWSKIADIPSLIGQNASFTCNSKGYCGYPQDLYEFNPVSNEWSKKLSALGDAYPWDNLTSFTSIGNAVYACNFLSPGWIFGNFYKYTPSAESWEELTEFNMGMQLCETSFLLSNNIYALTDIGFSKYSIDNNIWQKIASKPSGTNFSEKNYNWSTMASYVSEEMGHVIFNYSREVWVFDEMNNQWMFEYDESMNGIVFKTIRDNNNTYSINIDTYRQKIYIYKLI
jgi:hypothetical protein